MWTQLQHHSSVQAPRVSDHPLKTPSVAAADDVAQAYSQSAAMGAVWRADPRRNQILHALSDANYERIQDALEVVNLAPGQLIYESGDALQHVYFPTTCTASLLSSTAEGETVELALADRHGLIGAPLVLGGASMEHSVQIQCAGQACRMSAERFSRLLQECAQFQQMALAYVQSLMAQMAQSIICSRHHSVTERLSQWLLWNADGMDCDELMVTHETIAHMLGVRRESVTQAAGKMQAQGLIRNRRGKIAIQSREGLLQSVCECYGRIQSDSAQYLQRLHRLSDRPAYAGAPLATQWDADHVQPVTRDLQKYVDVYDFAPVGFVTLDVEGCVMLTNLTGAIMLDTQRSQCQHKAFIDFLDSQSRESFLCFHQEVLSGQCRRHCMVNLPASAHRAAMHLRIDATADEEGQENRMVMIDMGAEHHEAFLTEQTPREPRPQDGQ